MHTLSIHTVLPKLITTGTATPTPTLTPIPMSTAIATTMTMVVIMEVSGDYTKIPNKKTPEVLSPSFQMLSEK